MKKSDLVKIIKEALTDKVKAVTVSVDKLQKGDTMAADKAKVTSIKKDGDNFEITLSGGKKLTYKKDKQVQIIRAGSTLNESTKDSVAQKEFKMNYSQLGKKEKEWVDDEIDNIEYKKKKKVVKEGEEKSVDQLMSDLGKAIKTDSDDDKAFLDALGALKSGVLAKIKNKVKKGAEDLKGHLDKKYTNENHEEGDDEYDTGGYVEAMGPELDKHIKAIAGIFQEWENGPATEPQMVGYAMYDLIEYIKRAIRR